MEYILTEMAERSFVIGRKMIGPEGRYTSVATCRNRSQAEKLVGLLNKSGDLSVELVREFHEAFGIESPVVRGVPGQRQQDVQDWLQEEGNSLLDTAKRVKDECSKLKKNGLDVTAMLRMQLMVEELGEVLVAMSQDDIVQVLHELADLRYVVDGTALACGVGDVYLPAIQEIHRANMSKLDGSGRPVIGTSGRVEKSKRFKKADVSKLLEAA